jgi:hypothetical protein
MGNTNKFVEWVKMVTTKFVEWTGKVINEVLYITGREVDTELARFMVYKIESVGVMGDIHIGELQELLTFQCVRDMRIQVKEYVIKIVEWARVIIKKVVYITVGKAKNMVYVKQMLVQHTHKVERDTRRQIKEDEPRIAMNFFGIKWAGFKVYVEGFMIMFGYTAMMEVAMMVYMMQMEETNLSVREECLVGEHDQGDADGGEAHQQGGKRQGEEHLPA